MRLLLALALLPAAACAFVPLGQKKKVPLAPPTKAMIFGDYSEEEYDQQLGLKDTLSRDQMGALARLAAAFSPNALQLKQIEHVNVLVVDNQHLDIEAVVCEDDGCVTLLIPVQFPSPCDDNNGGMDECVIDNLLMLDDHAATVIEQKELRERSQTADDYWRQELITCGDYDELPHWWMAGLPSDCTTIQSLLNGEDFLHEIKSLAFHHLQSQVVNRSFRVEQAAVAGLCPSGMILRARVTEAPLFAEETTQVRTVSIQFPYPVSTVEELRSQVLGAVSAAMPSTDHE